MINNQKEKIYSYYEIGGILFYWTMICFLPIILVFLYLFDIDKSVDIKEFMLILLSVNFFLTIVGTVVLIVKKDKLKRRIKAHYRGEFLYLLFLSGFAILGSVVIFDYLQGNRAYIANILVVLTAVILYLLSVLGKKYFKFDYMRRK
ncbi:MAG: hypothetical protein K9L64_03505 [Candidatus Izimaplasma sp.]|nr:hypothetical protein [Candidatus Izimaplasma bacterium]